MGDALGRLQDLLRQLFQFESNELDFGIYRIMNRKRGEIRRFIDEGLPEAVDVALRGGAMARQATLSEDLNRQRDRIRESLGEHAFGAEGELKEEFAGFPIAKDFLEARSRAVATVDLENLKATIFNHIYTFFSRYYDNGDFVSKRCYSRRQKFAVPYNGEEVYLHWANADHYYVKTGERFTDYTYRSGGVTVRFWLTAADTEQNDVKGEKRFFLALLGEAAYDEDARTVNVPFEYRPLDAKEQKAYGARNQQEKIIEEAAAGLPARLAKFPAALAALEPPAELERHLRRYTRRNTSDFFVHKNLKGFLGGELDFYLKHEVLDVDDLEAWGPENSAGWFEVMRAVKKVGRDVIAFLAQIEDFQKRLFEKKKLVVFTGYCITLDRVPEELYPEVAANSAQREEWKVLLAIDEIEGNLTTPGYSEPLSEEFLKANPLLVLDTRHFGESFKDRLLASIDDLDARTDGLLIEGENFQALNLLRERYREQVRCAYIDPPFNTGDDEFLFKDTYKHSSWLSMMEDRVAVARDLLSSDGSVYVHIDYTEKERLRLLLDKYFSYITEIIWRIGWISGYKSKANKYIRNHDTIYYYGKTAQPLFNKQYIPYPEGYVRRDGKRPGGEGYPVEDTWNCSELDPLHSIQIVSFSKEKVGNAALTQKNEALLERILLTSSNKNDTILDFFVGSGTTCAAAQKMGRKWIGVEMGMHFSRYTLPRMKRVLSGDRYGISGRYGWKGGGFFKYLKLESYEDALNNIAFVRGREGQEALELYGDDYLLNYMLDFETRDSETLFNVGELTAPFRYRLQLSEGGETRSVPVDLPETFAYLLGLRVRTRRVREDGGRRYLVYRGPAPERGEVAVIWRDTEGWTEEDFKRDRDFVRENRLTEGADEVFVNGDSFIPDARPLDGVFKRIMLAGPAVG